MLTTTLKIPARRHPAAVPERLAYGAIDLQVTSLDRAAQFWTDVLGLVQRETDGHVALGTDQRTLIVLHEGAQRPALLGHSGLYHVAIGVPTQGEFSRLMARALAHRVRIAPVDHLMSKAIYLHDPDGIGIEIAFETPERFGHFGESVAGFDLFDTEGRWHSGRQGLDARRELEQVEGSIEAAISADARIAHLHFNVPNIAPAVGFYRGLGFLPNLELPHLGFADLGAGSPYTHRLAVNAWQGPHLTPAPANSARLIRYVLQASDPALVAKAGSLPGARASGRKVRLVDVAGVSVEIGSATS